MRPLKILIAALALVLLSKGAYSQVAFVDTSFPGYSGPSVELNDSGFAILTTNTVYRTDKNGQILWEYSIDTGFIFSINESNDGNIVIFYSDSTTAYANNFNTICSVKKINNENGAIMWHFSLPQFEYTIAPQLFTTLTNGSLLIGGLYVPDNGKRIPRIAMVNVDSSGNLLWFKVFNNTNAWWRNSSVQGNSEGGAYLLSNNINSSYYVNGSSGSGTDTSTIIKINSTGNLVWQTNFGEKTDNNEYLLFYLYSLIENPVDLSVTALTNYIISDDTMVKVNLGFIKIDKNGKLVKTFPINDTAFSFQQGYCASIVNGNYTIVGQEDSQLCYLQTDNNGNLIWIKNYPTPSFNMTSHVKNSTIGTTYIYSIYPVSDTGLVISGDIYVVVFDNDFYYIPVSSYLMKYGKNYDTGIPALNPQTTSLLIYPNPTTDNLEIISGVNLPNASIKIYNVQGQQLLTTPLSLTQGNPQSLDVSSLSNGLYLITLQTGDGVITRKFIKE